MPTAVSEPVEDTVATAVFDETHVACVVTLWVVPLEKVAVAMNGLEPPTAGGLPLSATELTEDVVGSPVAAATGALGPVGPLLLLQAATKQAPRAALKRRSLRTIGGDSQGAISHGQR